jgi:peroxiredoxin
MSVAPALKAQSPIPEQVARLPLLTQDATRVELRDCWTKRDALLLCVRHFGCVACAEQVGLLRERLAECEALGLNVVIIGCANPNEIAAWMDREQLAQCNVTVWTDPTLAVHRALGLHHGVWRTWGPRAAVRFLKSVAKGYRPGRFIGEVSQQAGALVVDQRGTLWTIFRSEFLGDLPSLSMLIEAAMTARLSRESLRL